MPEATNFLDQNNPSFRGLHRTLDNLFRSLHQSGIGQKIQDSEIITKDEENRLWETGQMCATSPKALFNAIFHYNGKNFCLRGGDKHRQLKISQLEHVYNLDGFVYHEYVSTNRLGTYKQLHIPGKKVPVYSCPHAGERCHVHLVKLYLEKLSKDAFESDNFYVRPLEKYSPSGPWFSAVPVRKHTLFKMVKNMCDTAGIVGNKTNHSLRATSATEMYNSEQYC